MRCCARRYWKNGWHWCAVASPRLCFAAQLLRTTTGCSGPLAARLALMRAQRQLYQDAGVHIHIRNFSVRPNRI
jgi:hypothetical protein